MAVNLNLHEPYQLRDALQAALGVPVTLENDVRTAAWGAYHRANTIRPIASLAYLSIGTGIACLLYTSPSPRDRTRSRMPSAA